MAELDQVLNSTTRGQQVDMIAWDVDGFGVAWDTEVVGCVGEA